MRFLFAFSTLFLLGTQNAFAQIDAGEDITICSPQNVNLSSVYVPNSVGTNDYTLENIPLNMDPFANGSSIGNLTDDSFSGVVDIGFNFCFYSNFYNELLISTNNYVTFDLTEANGYSPWNTYEIPSAFPPGEVINAIMGPWMDLNPNNGGNLYYNVYGVAPFRRFVVSFENFGYYSCSGMAFNGQIKLFETTNVIEIHIQDQPLCDTWNNGESVLGIVNEDESQFLIETGWNNTQLTGNNEAFRFVPSGAALNNIVWTDDLGVVVGNGINIDVFTNSTTTYTCTAYECPDEITDQVTVFVSDVGSATINTLINDNNCPGEISASIDITVNNVTTPYIITWTSTNSFSSNQEDIINLEAGDYSLLLSDDFGCESNFGPFTISPPPPPIQFSESIDPVSCYGFSDGTVAITVSGGTPNYSYQWSGNNPITGETTSIITDLAAGIYQVVITDNNGCQNSASYEVTQNSSINVESTASNFNGYNNRCYGGNEAWISCVATGGLLPYQYLWINESLDTVSTQADVYGLVTGTYDFIVTDAEGCPNFLSFEVTQPDSVAIDLSNYSHKSCTYNDDGFIEVVTWGGPDNPVNSQNYFPLEIEWKGVNSFYSTDENIYNLSNGLYTISVTDINNCTNDLSFEITEPPVVIADYWVMNDTVTINYPFVNLYDRSKGNIVDWQWELSNGFYASSQDIFNLDLSTNFDSTGIKYFDLKLVVTDEFMCQDSTFGKLAIKDEHTLYVPNSFTPDLDGNNDIFRIYHKSMKTETFSIKIFDRFGSVIFQSNNPDVEWDGTNMFTSSKIITGTYTYLIKYQDFEGRIYDHTNCENCSGTITLLR